MNETEQWLDRGDCSICRRKKYCSKPCTTAKRIDAVELQSMVIGAMADVIAKGANKE